MMFLSAVYYFVGMSKLSATARAPFIKEFNKQENLETIKEFFEVFKAGTKGKYNSLVDEVIAAPDYNSMAPKFMSLLAKILESKDLEGLCCYCDDPFAYGSHFFFSQIILPDLRAACRFCDTSYRVLEMLLRSGINTQYAFNGIDLKDITRQDILGLSAFDLAALGYASILKRDNDEVSKNAIPNYIKLFESLIYHTVDNTPIARTEFYKDTNALRRTEFFVRELNLNEISKYCKIKNSYFDADKSNEVYEYSCKVNSYLMGYSMALYTLLSSDVVNTEQPDIYHIFSGKILAKINFENVNFFVIKDYIYNISSHLWKAIVFGYAGFTFSRNVYDNANQRVIDLITPDFFYSSLNNIVLIMKFFEFGDSLNTINSLLDNRYLRTPIIMLTYLTTTSFTFNFAKINYDKLFDMIGVRFSKLDSLAYISLAAIALTPLAISAFMKADKFIFEIAQSAPIDEFINNQKASIFENFTSASR